MAPHKAGFAVVWESILKAYKALRSPVQLTSMSLTAFVPAAKNTNKFTKLSGKGAEVKHLVKPLLLVWDEYSRKSSHDQKVSSTLAALDKMQDLLDEYSRECFFPELVAETFQNHTDDFLHGYTWLGLRADERGQYLFTAAPKLHYL